MELRSSIRHEYNWCVRYAIMRITLLYYITPQYIALPLTTSPPQYHLATNNSSLLIVIMVGYQVLGSFSARFHH
jgi:hypothetical protein